MTWFVWVKGLRGPSPRKVFDSAGDAPFLDSSVKDVVIGTPRRLGREEELLSLDVLEKRYPAPLVKEDA